MKVSRRKILWSSLTKKRYQDHVEVRMLLCNRNKKACDVKSFMADFLQALPKKYLTNKKLPDKMSAGFTDTKGEVKDLKEMNYLSIINLACTPSLDGI